MSKLIIIGAGGHGKVVADATQEDCVFLDDVTKSDEVIGTISDLGSVQDDDDEVFVAVGDNAKRIELLSSLNNIATIVHPSAIVSENATIGEGTIVCAGAIVQTGASIGRGCIINTRATVDHGCNLGDGVHVSPGANVGGDVSIGSCTWVGIGASVKHGINIGSGVIVGAGATVVNDVPDDITVVGVPAKELAT